MLHMGRRQPSTSRTHSAGASRSQAMLEFALALPVLLMLIFGIVDFALIFQAWLSVENIARQTVRLAVTGEYDPSFCPVIGPGGLAGCQGDTYLQEQDVARLETIRRDAGQWEVALFKSPTNNQSAKGYLHVTVCSNRDADHSGTPDFVYTQPVLGSSTYAACSPTEDAGGQGDNVYIFVDFNHPLITPFLSQIWPIIHLVSYRQGVVETFRTSRSIAQLDQGLQPPTQPHQPPVDTFTPAPPPGTPGSTLESGTETPHPDAAGSLRAYRQSGGGWDGHKLQQ